MNVNARTATAGDFDAAAQSKANQSWFFLIVAAIVGYLAGWFALIPAGVALLFLTQSISATSMAGKLRTGTYPIPNFNNGAPDGDARNLSGSPGSTTHDENEAT